MIEGKRTRKLLPVLMGLGAGLLLAVPAGQSSGDAVGPIRITSREVSYERVDIGKRGTSPGDMEIIRQSLFNRRVTTKAGAITILRDSRRSWQARSCRGTYFLPRGRLVVGGSLLYRQFYELAVLGGTGVYNNAHGTLTVTRTATAPTREVVLFRLVG